MTKVTPAFTRNNSKSSRLLSSVSSPSERRGMWLLCMFAFSLSPLVGCEHGRGPVQDWIRDHAHISSVATIEPRNTHLLPNQTTDQGDQPMTITGLSGITYLGPEPLQDELVSLDPQDRFEQRWHRFAAIADSKTAIIVLMRVRFSLSGNIRDVEVNGCTRLQHRLDFEGITVDPRDDGEVEWVWLSDEQQKNPGIHRYSLSSGSRLETLDMPDILRARCRVSATRRAAYPVRKNMGLESLTRSWDGTELWTATEQAVIPDGPTATDQVGTTVRLMRFVKLSDGTIMPIGQYAYRVDPIHGPKTRRAVSGLVEMVMTPHGHMLALERSAVESLNPFEHRLYMLDFRDADDVTAWRDGLAAEGAKPYAPVEKILIWKTSWVTSPGNLEGLCVGPRLPNGNFIILGVVDDGDPISGNVLVSFELGVERLRPVMAVR